MRPAVAALSLLAGAALASLAMRRIGTTESADGEASQETPGLFDLDPFAPFYTVSDLLQPTDASISDRNRAAFLLTIRQAEGTAGPNGYRTLFGGSLFTGWADHPRIAKRFTNGNGQQLWTTAAGAYQFLAVSLLPDGSGRSTKVNTWDRISERLALPDFSPASQDLAALELIREAGALGDVDAGRFDQAVSKVRRIWASLPGAGYAQPEKSLHVLRLAYLDAGGTLA